MIRLLSSIIGYMCVGTVISLGVGLGYFWYSGKLNDEKVFRMLAVLHDVELDPQKTDAQQTQRAAELSQLSYEDIEEARKIKSRILELKMQSLNKGLNQVSFERGELSKDKERYLLLRTSFEQRLKELQEETENTGQSNVRMILENIAPKKAKEQIMQMVEAEEMEDVVHILSEMPIGKRAKIVSQFTTDQEQEVLDKLLRLIRQGGAVTSLVNETLDDTRQQ